MDRALQQKIITDAKTVGADYVLYNIFDGDKYSSYSGHVVTVYFMQESNDGYGNEVASYQPADLAGIYMGFGFPEIKLYNRRWGSEMISKYNVIRINRE